MAYLYSVNYQVHEEELSNLERRALFGESDGKKVFFSNTEVAPSHSPYIKLRMHVAVRAETFDEILVYLDSEKPKVDGFKVDYIKLSEQDLEFKNRRHYCKEIGMKFLSYPDFKEPKKTFGITFFENTWFYGHVEYNDSLWRKHNEKPYTYSSSLGMHLAKALVNIGTQGNLNKTIIDPCCGVGTVILEAVYAGYSITGCDIMKKVTLNAEKNLEYFDYQAQIILGDIKNIVTNYDVAIVDLPYGICTSLEDDLQSKIIKNAKRIAKRIVLVSQKDISKDILRLDLKLVDHCQMRKNKKHHFKRFIWVCE